MAMIPSTPAALLRHWERERDIAARQISDHQRILARHEANVARLMSRLASAKEEAARRKDLLRAASERAAEAEGRIAAHREGHI